LKWKAVPAVSLCWQTEAVPPLENFEMSMASLDCTTMAIGFEHSSWSTAGFQYSAAFSAQVSKFKLGPFLSNIPKAMEELDLFLSTVRAHRSELLSLGLIKSRAFQ
jgi:hypothetical protein